MILSFAIECNSLDQFLDHWSERYRYPRFGDRDKYDPYVGKDLTEPSRLHLFEWKNGSSLSKSKRNSVSKNYPLSFPKNKLEKRYLDPKASGGAIWNIFYMHCIDPETWPIFDQHTYRAMHFMKTGKLIEIPSVKAKVYVSYKNEYIPFVKKLNSDQRKIDKALFAFGQFLKMASAYR
jgi:hypothetical protein